MPLATDTPCSACRQRIGLHRIIGTRAKCNEKETSPNLLAPEVLQIKLTLGHKIPYRLMKEAQEIEDQRAAAATTTREDS